MTNKRIKHELIEDESKRNATLIKRKESLLKKAEELSVLCGVDVAVVVHKRRQIGGSEDDENHDNDVVWPSSSMFRERLHRFFNFNNFEINRRMITHEKYMEQRTNDEAESSSRSKKRVEFRESQQLMRQILIETTDYNNNLQELDLSELNGLNSVADEMLAKLEMKENDVDDELINDDQVLHEIMAHPPPPPPPRQEMGGGEASSSSSGRDVFEAGMVASTSSQLLVPATELENLRNEQWFIDAMSEDQDDFLEPPQPPDAGGVNVSPPPPPSGE